MMVFTFRNWTSLRFADSSGPLKASAGDDTHSSGGFVVVVVVVVVVVTVVVLGVGVCLDSVG
ncbi:Uncharacterised protein [Mycobacteroides abscessus subsp. bolletii]|nr:Uncharacterised protein [Mycobacteroides abscessus subsp. bolletii]